MDEDVEKFSALIIIIFAAFPLSSLYLQNINETLSSYEQEWNEIFN